METRMIVLQRRSGRWPRTRAYDDFGFRLPMFQPQLRNVLTTLGVIETVIGTRMKMKDLWMA